MQKQVFLRLFCGHGIGIMAWNPGTWEQPGRKPGKRFTPCPRSLPTRDDNEVSHLWRCLFISLVGGATEPLQPLDLVALQTFATQVHKAEIVLCVCVAPFSCTSVTIQQPVPNREAQSSRQSHKEHPNCVVRPGCPTHRLGAAANLDPLLHLSRPRPGVLIPVSTVLVCARPYTVNLEFILALFP